MTVDILTPDAKLFSGEATYVVSLDRMGAWAFWTITPPW